MTEDSPVVSMLERYNRWVGLQIKINDNKTSTSTLNVLESMIFNGKAMVILAYEYLLSSKYKETIEKDEEFKFLKYIRNGAAHNNRFNLKHQFGPKKGEWVMAENEVIEWKGKKISRKLQDTNVFNDFISFFEVFLLVKHFSERLTRIDISEK